jgi:hypothetical protein
MGEPANLPQSGVLPAFGKSPLPVRILVTSVGKTDEMDA